ncbi:hypothetical protein GALL_406110 [mine drainage metagenome]|uniref:Uncharacterized protein n=1 Tax=mine drainage metagenome TaxID=410659 RepID=A0A1J5Q312_9ZZZZ
MFHDTVGHPQVPDQPGVTGRHLQQAAPPGEGARTEMRRTGAGQRRQPDQLEGEPDRCARGRRPAAEQPERQRQVRVEVGGRSDGQQVDIDRVEPEHVGEPGKAVLAGRAGPVVLVAQDAHHGLEPRPDRRLEATPAVDGTRQRREQSGQPLTHHRPPPQLQAIGPVATRDGRARPRPMPRHVRRGPRRGDLDPDRV